jgi:superfamily II DNA or RNA helicase
MDNNIKKKLYPYQIEHTENLIRIVKDNNAVLDSSDTGTGKTYCAVAAIKILNLRPIVICPKSVIYTWNKVFELFDIKPLCIVNYELIKHGKINHKNKKFASFLDINEIKQDKYKKGTLEFKFNPPKSSIVILDEVHRCSNINSENCRLMLSIKDSGVPMMLLSATIADYPEKFKPFFYVLNFISPQQVKDKNIDKFKYMKIVDEWIKRDQRPMVRIHNMLFPERCSRMRIEALGNLFPETQIIAQPYTIEDERRKEIEREYSILKLELDKIAEMKTKDKPNPLVLTMRAFQKIEILKIPLFVEIANDFIEQSYSVVIFVNFTQTLKSLGKLLNCDNLIYGEQSQEERHRIIEEFQENKIRLIICNIKAGGIGISLHDMYGVRPRISLVSPTWSSIDLVQALGRIHRAGGKSRSLQRIIYTADTVEERIADKIKLKLNNINSINNGDLDLTNIDFKKIRAKF